MNSNFLAPLVAIWLVLLPQWLLAQDDLPEAIVLPAPEVPAGGGQSGSIELSLVESKANKIIDDEEWWERNELENPEVYARFPATSSGAVSEGVPQSYAGQPLVAIWKSAGRRLFAYGPDPYQIRYLLAEAAGKGKREIEYVFDAEQYGTVGWAAIVDGMLYLTNNPGNLSAKDGGGARLFAIDLETRRLKWASPKKTCSGQFLVIAGSVVCAYGFTGEPDFIYVFDRFTGDESQKIKLKTAADWLIKKGELLYVRCYNTDNVYRIEIKD